MGLREFFTDLAELMQRHGVDVSAENHDGDGVLHFTCEDETELDVPFTVNAQQARNLAGWARSRNSFPTS